MSVANRIAWVIVNKDGYPFLDTISDLRKESVFQVTRNGRPWSTYKDDGFRAEKILIMKAPNDPT